MRALSPCAVFYRDETRCKLHHVDRANCPLGDMQMRFDWEACGMLNESADSADAAERERENSLFPDLSIKSQSENE